MARPARICESGVPLHVVQRGNNRQSCFRNRGDYLRYMAALERAAGHYGVLIHAYALMTNHVHMLVTPDDREGVSKMMQALGSRYVRAFNRIHQRTGTLWEGRFGSFQVTSEFYLFACYRYIELNPVRAGIVATPAAYPWSSFRANALGSPSTIVCPRPEWSDLGHSQAERCARYRRLFESVLDHETMTEIRSSLKSGSELGSEMISDPNCD